MIAPRRPRQLTTLRRAGSLPVWVSIGWRVLLVLALVGAAIGVHWFDRAGLRDNYDGRISFADVVYFTMISITTTGYGDIAPVTERARLFDALIVTPIRVFVILLFVGTAYSFVFRRTWDKWRMALIQRNLTGHIVVAGFGISNTQAVDELIARGTDPRRIVVVDQSATALERAEALGCNVLQADATRDETLASVRIAEAHALVVSAGRDDTSILITLTARHLAPDLRISTSVRAADNEFPARAAGATTVINPTSFAGLLLAGSCEGPHIAEYLTDLAAIDGRVALKERAVAPGEVGKPLSAIASGLAVRLYRADTPHDPTDPAAATLQAGDTIVEIVTRT